MRASTRAQGAHGARVPALDVQAGAGERLLKLALRGGGASSDGWTSAGTFRQRHCTLRCTNLHVVAAVVRRRRKVINAEVHVAPDAIGTGDVRVRSAYCVAYKRGNVAARPAQNGVGRHARRSGAGGVAQRERESGEACGGTAVSAEAESFVVPRTTAAASARRGGTAHTHSVAASRCRRRRSRREAASPTQAAPLRFYSGLRSATGECSGACCGADSHRRPVNQPKNDVVTCRRQLAVKWKQRGLSH